MDILSSLAALLSSLSERGLHTLEALVEAVRSLFGGDAETRRRVAFSVAMIALAAKMAKADGIVSPSELAAFRQVFSVDPAEERNVMRFWDLAKADTAGYEAWASRMAALCSDGDGGCPLLQDVLDGLFHIAKADGSVHPRELEFLERVAGIFGLDADGFEAVRRRHVRDADGGPWAVLGVSPGEPLRAVRARYLELVRENHPDRLVARGVPDEFMAIGLERMKAINAAWDEVSGRRAA